LLFADLGLREHITRSITTAELINFEVTAFQTEQDSHPAVNITPFSALAS
jgi:hypothetical protein